jgi:hypothetical protein
VHHARAAQVNETCTNTEGTITQLPQRHPERDLHTVVGLRADRQGGFGGLREADQIAHADVGAAEAVPPRLNEAAPGAALLVGVLHHLVEVGEEAVDACDLEDTADHL